MFTADSRYADQPTYTVTLPDGTQVTAVIPPLPDPVPLVGYYQRVGPRTARPRRGAVPQRADRLLAALRREQLDARRRPRRPGAHRHPAGRYGVSVTVQLAVGGHAGARRALRRDRSSWRSRRARTGPARCCCSCR